jgi:eukaryotic-like serine/threonine-protein kinase
MLASESHQSSPSSGQPLPNSYVDELLTRLRAALSGRYHLEHELGRGGMATVYLARDLKHDRDVALKVLHSELAASLGTERFQREIRLAARLQHPHILTVLDSGEAGGRLWFTMPYVEGENLRSRLNRERQLGLEDAVRIGREAALALEYAHQHGVIHRDIKPENLLLTKDGSTLVADFGIARALAVGDPELTGTGIAIGTPAYMSPEQASGARDIDARTDIYSLGAVLYEMLAGEAPFSAPTAQAMIARRFTDTPRLLRTLRDTVPESIERAVAKALAKVPGDRFSTASQFAQALGLTTSAGLTTSVSVPPVRRRWIPIGLTTLGVGFLLGLGVLFAWRRSHDEGTTSGGNDRKMLVVLPFENLGSAEDEYFADGLTEAIGTRLGSIDRLGIIARQSAMQYKRTTKSPRQIGQELGVQYILSGTVRWDRSGGGPSRVRVSPQLIAVADQRQLWAQQYDTTLASVFEVESNLAKRVASALDLALAASERRSLEATPTRNLQAYDAYLRGREVNDRGLDPSDLTEAVRLYERAVALDPDFAAAYAYLSLAHSFIYWLYIDRSDTRLAKAKAAVDRAQQLAPELPETHLALANYHYRSVLDYDRALAELDALERTRPNDTDLGRWRGFIKRRQGQWEESIVELQRAERLNPRSAAGYLDVGDSFLYLRRYADALAYYDKSLALNPGSINTTLQKALAYLSQTGDREGMQRLMPDLTQGVAPIGGPTGILGLAELAPLLSRDQQSLLLRLTPDAFSGDTASLALAKAMVLRAWERGTRARAEFNLARSVLERHLVERPDDYIFLAEHGLTLAGLGLAEEAIRQGKRAVEVRSTSRDAVDGPLMVANLARIYTMIGRDNDAIDQLEAVLSRPGPLSPGWLGADPFWAPLRGNPRFGRLAAPRSVGEET